MVRHLKIGPMCLLCVSEYYKHFFKFGILNCSGQTLALFPKFDHFFILKASPIEIPVFQNEHFSKIQPTHKSCLFEFSFLWLTHFVMLTKKVLKSEKRQFGHKTFETATTIYECFAAKELIISNPYELF